MHTDDELPSAWQRLIGADSTRLDGLLRRYRERHRRYHNTAHLVAVVDDVEQLAAEEPVTDLAAVVAAAFYHDAVYEPLHPANERASARLASRDLAEFGWEPARVQRVATMIEATRDHLDPRDVDTAVLFDADLAVLGSDPEAYRSYVTAVRSEYSHLDGGEWKTGRTKVLQSFLDRPTIFATRSGLDRWSSQATTNLTAELAALS